MSSEGAPSAAGTPVDTARSFVNAVAWGEHHTVWDLLAEEARRTILRIALTRGMDEDQVTRLAQGTAASSEREEFLTDLVNGLRADLLGVDVDTLEYEADPDPPGTGQARVVLTSPFPATMSVVPGGLPAGSLEMVQERGGWRVDRLVPAVRR